MNLDANDIAQLKLHCSSQLETDLFEDLEEARESVQRWRDRCQLIAKERDEARAEIERLKHELAGIAHRRVGGR